MSFVNEVISEEDKARINWDEYRARPASIPVSPYSWTIDRDRDAFFMELMPPGRGHEPSIYVLSWRGTLIRVQTILTYKNTGIKKKDFTSQKEFTLSDVHWDIIKIMIPEPLETDRQFIQNLLQEAIQVHGDSGSPAIRDRIAAVTISIR